MSWQSKFVVFRAEEGCAELAQVFVTDDFKKAKYWVAYIAEENDALFRTPAHPKHPGGEDPVYFCHKIGSGKTETDEAIWKGLARHLPLPKSEQKMAE